MIVIAIPANNEADRIEGCLAALATQRDKWGAPLPAGSFEVLVYANNCSDGTAGLVERLSSRSPHPISVVSEFLPRHQANAGWARKRAMDLAASRLSARGNLDGLILTTDADSVVGATWIDATRRAMFKGVDCVAGYIDGHPRELMRLSQGFIQRGRLEDCYLRVVAEMYALCDPRSHDPWPNHRVSSGASLAVTLAAYRAIGGLPPKAVGEDAALTAVLEQFGFKVRHSMEVCVTTSCRFDGRAEGGAADTMRQRHETLEAPCDEELEPALPLLRRALLKGYLRGIYEQGDLHTVEWANRFGLDATAAGSLVARPFLGFEELWLHVVEAAPALRTRQLLRPSDLPRQIERGMMCLRIMRRSPQPSRGAPGDSPDRSGSSEAVAA